MSRLFRSIRACALDRAGRRPILFMVVCSIVALICFFSPGKEARKLVFIFAPLAGIAAVLFMLGVSNVYILEDEPFRNQSSNP